MIRLHSKCRGAERASERSLKAGHIKLRKPPVTNMYWTTIEDLYSPSLLGTN